MCAASLLLTLGLGHARAQSPSALTFDAAVARALQASPTVEAARRRVEAATFGVDVARQRPNPEARVEFEKETPTQAYTLGLPIETGGKRGRRIALGTAGVEVSRAELERTTLEVRVSVRKAYFALVGASARAQVLQDLVGLATRAEDAAQQRFDAGDVPRLEVLQAHLARLEAENQAAAATGEVNAARAQLNALFAAAPDAPLDASTPFDSGLTALPPTATGETANVDLALLDRQLAEQQARVALANTLNAPDLLPEATLTRGAEPEFSTGWRVSLGVAVPLLTTRKPSVQLETATFAALTAERRATAARVAADVASARATAEALLQQFRRYQAEILPQASEVERLSEDSYRLGRTGIAAYLQALQATRDVRLRMLQVGAEFHTALSELERALGRPLP